MTPRSLGICARAAFTAALTLGLASSVVGACKPVDREFPTGQGGSGGSALKCEPGTSERCYTGPAGTEDIGACKHGMHTCLPTGDGYGECGGEVIPTKEICTTAIDEGCDGPNPVECPSLGHAWSKSFGGMGEDIVTAVAVDPISGDVIATGYFANMIDLGGGPMASTGSNDIFLVRMSADGEHRWSKRFGDADSQTPRDIAVDSTGAIYIVGEMYGSIDFGDGKPLTSKGSSDAFAAKFDGDGKMLWGRLFGDALSQEATSVAITPTNQVIVAGNFSGFIQLMGMELPSNGTDVFVLKLDSSGFDVAAKKYGSAKTDQLADVATDSKGAIFVTGQYDDIADFGTLGMFPNAGDSDAFVLKLNPDLSEAWVRTYGDMQFQRGGTVTTSTKDDVFVMGDFVGTMTMGDGSMLTSIDTNQRSVFVMSLNTDGAHRWAKNTGNGTTFFARQMVVSDPSSQAIVAVGFYDGTFDFGGGPIMADVVDAFAVKMAWDGTYISSKRFGGPKLDGFFNAAVSPQGDIFVCGLHQGPADFGGGLFDTPAGPDDIQGVLIRLLP